MPLSVQKDERLNIQKLSGGASVFVLGLGWNSDADLDASAVMCKQIDDDLANSKCVGEPGFIFFNQKRSASGAVVHMGDALTGEGNDAADNDELIVIDTAKLAQEGADQLDLWVTIFKAVERKQKFSNVKGAFVRIYAMPDGFVAPASKDALDVILRPLPALTQYDLTEDYSLYTAVQFGCLYLKAGEWRFGALNQGLSAEIGDIIHSYLPNA